jgi:hypothetical protein
MCWRRPLIRGEEIVIEWCVGFGEWLWGAEIELFSVIDVQGRGFIIELWCFSSAHTLLLVRKKVVIVYLFFFSSGGGGIVL